MLVKNYNFNFNFRYYGRCENLIIILFEKNCIYKLILYIFLCNIEYILYLD